MQRTLLIFLTITAALWTTLSQFFSSSLILFVVSRSPLSANTILLLGLLFWFSIANGFNFIMTSLAWRSDGQGNLNKGVKILGFTLLAEFLIFLVILLNWGNLSKAF